MGHREIEMSELHLRAARAHERTQALLDILRWSLAVRASLQKRAVELGDDLGKTQFEALD